MDSSNECLAFKSCNKCHDIYARMQAHITLEHIPSGPEGVISGVIINLLSLMVPKEQQKQTNQPTLAHTIPVIANKQSMLPSFSQEFATTSSEIMPRLDLQLPSILNFHAKEHFQLQQHDQQQQQHHHHQQHQQQLQQQQHSAELKLNTLQKSHLKEPVMTVKPQRNDSLLNSLHKDAPRVVSRRDKYQDTNVNTQSHQENNDIVDSQQGNGFVNADGTLTPAGISLILSYQSGRPASGSKTELDDIADILVNKMPIPSLKGLEASNYQLSTFYLQQFALNQLQQAMISTNPTLLPTPVLDHLNNATGATNAVKVSSNTTHLMPDSSIKNTNDVADDEQPDETTSSIRHLLEQHKHISALIEALNIKPRTSDYEEQLHDMPMVENVVSLSTSPSVSSSIQQLISSPQVFRQTETNTNKQKNNRSGETLLLPSNVLQKTSSTTPTTNIMQLTTTHPISTQSTSTSHGNSATTEQNSVAFSRNKHLSAASLTVTSHPSMHNLQTLILGTAKRIALDADTSVTNRNVVSVAVTPSDSKSPITTLQGIIVEAPSKADNLNMSGAESSVTANIARAYSGLTTMVPLPEYNTGTDTMESGSANVSIQTPKVLYRCEHCGVTFSVLSTLQNHIKREHSEKSEFCNFCQLSFQNHEEYYTHIASHRGEESILTCQYCAKIFTSDGDFKKHLAKHTQRRPYICGHCQKAFRDPGSLAKHERIHTGEQPFVCEICHRGFAEKSSLRKHSRVHSGEKPYKCTECDKSFSISGNLQRHMFIHSGEKPFRCTLCTKAFNNPSHLRRHIKNLHNKVESTTTTETPETSTGSDTKIADMDMELDCNSLVVPRTTVMEASSQDKNS